MKSMVSLQPLTNHLELLAHAQCSRKNKYGLALQVSHGARTVGASGHGVHTWKTSLRKLLPPFP